MANIDTRNRDALAGAVYFVLGMGTEGGASSYHLSIAGITSGTSDPGWGDASNVMANSGYSIGAVQVDLGQRGTWPLGAVGNDPLEPGQKTYVDAIIDQASTYAKDHSLKFTDDLDRLRSDLLSHGDGTHKRSKISFIDEGTRDSINAWASSAEGRKWIHKNIDYPQIKAVTEISASMIEKYGKNVPEEHRFETLSILAKTANQISSQLDKYKTVMESGGNYDDIMKEAQRIKSTYGYYDGPKAGALGEKYKVAYNDPGQKDSLDRANIKVSSLSFDPSNCANDSDIKEALNAIGQFTHFQAADRSPGILQLGSHGEAVNTLQIGLNELGYLNASPDSHFGPLTKAAVQNFQRDHGLRPDGTVGAATQRSLHADVAMLQQQSPTMFPSHSATPGPGLDDPRNILNPHHALYNELKMRIPDASENRLLQFTAACHLHQINAENLGRIYFNEQDGIMTLTASWPPGPPATVDVKTPSPEPQQSIQHIQQYDQRHTQMMSQIHAQNAQANAHAQPGPMR